MTELFFAIGLPRSGKSTRLKSLSYNCDIFSPRIIIDPDDIRLSFGHRYNWYLEQQIKATKLAMIRTLIHKYNILVDDTHTTKQSILDLLLINPDAKFIFIDTPPSVCKDRARETNQDDLCNVIDRMYYNLVRLVGLPADTQRDNMEMIDRYLPEVVNKLRLEAQYIKENFERIV